MSSRQARLGGSEGNAALELRARLSDRHPGVVRRHTLRLGSRIGILAASDLLAFLAARAVLRTLAAHPATVARLPEGLTSVGPLANPGAPGSLVFLFALLLGLTVTSSYTRHRRLNTAARLGAATLIAIAAAAVPLAALIGVRGAIAQTILVGAVTWTMLLFFRSVTDRFLERGWPRDRWAGPAIIVGPEGAAESPAVRAISRPGGDYKVAAHHLASDSADRVDARSLAEDVRRLIDQNDAEAVVM